MTSKNAFIACHRFGLGPHPGEMSQAAGDPQGWLRAQLSGPLPRLRTGEKRLSAADKLANLHLAPKEERGDIRRGYFDEIKLLVDDHFHQRQISKRPYAERLAAFWGNHFAVGNNSRAISSVITDHYADAIRPYMFGSFKDLLVAALTHPVMIGYLDNHLSFGPNSPLGELRKVRMNENLARETLELHTLGVNGGYTQDDVVALAKVYTGWSFTSPKTLGDEARYAEKIGGFGERRIGGGVFFSAYHERGPKTVLGKTYEEEGHQELLKVLEDLAAHPATARHIATKLVRHFVADDPPGGAVKRIETVFLRTGGNLPSVYEALIDLPHAWQQPFAKAKTMVDFVTAADRALIDYLPEPTGRSGILHNLGQAPLRPPSPEGFSDREEAWLTAAGVQRRLAYIALLSRKLRPPLLSVRVFEDTIGPVVSKRTDRAVFGAASAKDAVGLILASPEFQRR
ncbi:DUF1800 domain-containing protein [Parvularcula maris]|uniref:DUF1800 domain-containing protein n=1 Tax=Parvularcula maris TaxID=2965077 RepID=A0A9X2L8X2_9PROT|nr:DUF1800 domain-containing protein [Parvularcula maris]MCQ8185284.1 DUF1800 domain-containing protein [Parvularcula maris]